jgi:glycosyltransferase involved in cell wall biosynthesis
VTGTTTKALHVAFVAPSLRNIGGQSVSADLLMRHWTADGGVAPIFIPTDPPFPALLCWIEEIRFLRTIVRLPIYWWSLWRGVRQSDLVHIFSASYTSFLIATLPAIVLAKVCRRPAIVNYHSGEARDHLARWPATVFILRRVEGIVVSSQFLVDVFAEFGLRTDAIPNIVDLAQITFRRRTRFRPKLLCTRNFDTYYSVDVVVRAFALVCAEVPEAELVLVGSGPREMAIRVVVEELGLQRQVRFAGAVPRCEIGQYYEAADIFINASWLDNMPVSILEAFAAGTPVATTGPEGIRYLVEHEHTGLVSQPGDVEELARNVMRMLREPELATELAEGAKAQTARYGWDRVREQWLHAYWSLLSMCGFASRHDTGDVRHNNSSTNEKALASVPAPLSCGDNADAKVAD